MPVEVPGPPFSQLWYDNLKLLLGESGCRTLGFYAIPEGFLLSVVIPVYNERHTLMNLIEQVKRVPVRKEIILVEDFSKDGTREMLQELQKNPGNDPLNTLSIYFHDVNKGKGAGVKTGFMKATGNVVIIQDADLEYDPGEIPRLLQPIIEGRADVVFGSRFLGDQPHRVLYFWHYLANKFLTTLSNCFSNLNLTDMETCYKLFRREVIHQIAPNLKQQRFGIEPELTQRVSDANCRIFEMSISYHGRTYDEGKKIGWKDGVQAIYCIIAYGAPSMAKRCWNRVTGLFGKK